MKKILIRLTVVLIVAAGAWGAYSAYKKLPQQQQSTLPTAKVRQGDVVVRSFARGELRAVRSATLTAPNLFGTVQVTRLAALGSFAREKDLVAEFDDSELLSRLEEKQLELDQLDEQIKKSQADLSIRDNQDQVELLRARYSVRRSELEVKRNELISAIDAKKNELSLEEARRRLKQLESDIQSRRQQAQAELAVLRERKNKAIIEMNRERQRLNQVKVLSPMSGLVAIRQNRGTGFFFSGMSLPDIREGDQIQPGTQVADILDLSEMEVVARVGELDRANLHEGQDVVLTLDALADQRLHGKIKNLSGSATANVFSSDPAKKFDVVFTLDMKELLTALGAPVESIQKILATAEANRKKAPVAPPMGMGGVMFAGGMPGGGMPGGGGMAGPQGGGAFPGGGMAGAGGAPGGAGGGPGAGGPGGAGGGPRMFTFAGPGGGAPGGAGGAGAMSPEQAQKMREIFQKVSGGKNPQEMTAEERQQMFSKLRDEMQKAGIQSPARGERKGGESKGGDAKGGESKGGERKGSPEGAAGEETVAARERKGGGRRGPGQGGPGGDMAMMGFGAGQQFSQKDLEIAKLPPPPEEGSQLDVLLRPGLLADVEIIVEKIPNAIHVPAQAVFQKEGKFLVYVRQGTRFTPREIKPLKRSESLMVIASGLNVGEEVAMQDPEAKPDQRKGGAKGGGGDAGGGPMTMPAGKKG